MSTDEFDLLLSKTKNMTLNDFGLSIDQMRLGILFMYSSWSHSVVQLRNLIHSLEPFTNIPVYVYDIDDPKFEEFKTKNNLHSDGWGETFWIKSGEIKGLKKKYTSNELEELININKTISFE